MRSQHTSTQQQHPLRASLRTVVQTFISTAATVGAVVPAVVGILDDELQDVLPEGWLRWTVTAATLVAAGAGAVARIMAIPSVDAWLTRLGVSSAPGPERVAVPPEEPSRP